MLLYVWYIYLAQIMILLWPRSLPMHVEPLSIEDIDLWASFFSSWATDWSPYIYIYASSPDHVSLVGANFAAAKGKTNKGGRGGSTNLAVIILTQTHNPTVKARGVEELGFSSMLLVLIVCQVCNKIGHAVALDCYHRFDSNYEWDSSRSQHICKLLFYGTFLFNTPKINSI